MANFNSATWERSKGLHKERVNWYATYRGMVVMCTYRFSRRSADSLTTGNVIARLLREEQNASTVFNTYVTEMRL